MCQMTPQQQKEVKRIDFFCLGLNWFYIIISTILVSARHIVLFCRHALHSLVSYYVNHCSAGLLKCFSTAPRRKENNDHSSSKEHVTFDFLDFSYLQSNLKARLSVNSTTYHMYFLQSSKVPNTYSEAKTFSTNLNNTRNTTHSINIFTERWPWPLTQTPNLPCSKRTVPVLTCAEGSGVEECVWMFQDTAWSKVCIFYFTWISSSCSSYLFGI